MKSVWEKAFVVAMAFAIWMSSTGIVLAVHTCLSSGNVDVTLYQPKGCCSDDWQESADAISGESFHAMPCCTLKMEYQKVQVVSQVKALMLKIPAIAANLHVVPGKIESSTFFSNRFQPFAKAPPPKNAAKADFIFSIHRLLI